MKIIINGQIREVDVTMLDQVMAEFGYAEQRVATALNGEFVPQLEWATTQLKEGDQIEVLAPMQGG